MHSSLEEVQADSKYQTGVSNAKFIAAAPAMAGALARLLPDFELDEDSHDGLVACEISVGDVKAIRAALLAAGYTEAADQE